MKLVTSALHDMGEVNILLTHENFTNALLPKCIYSNEIAEVRGS